MPNPFSNPELNQQFKRIAGFGGAAITAASLGLTGINPAHADVDVDLQNGIVFESFSAGDFTIFNTSRTVFTVEENGNITGTARSGINLQTDGGASAFAGANFGSTSLLGAETDIKSNSLVDAGTNIGANAGNKAGIAIDSVGGLDAGIAIDSEGGRDAGIAIDSVGGRDAGIDINSKATTGSASTFIRAEGGLTSEVSLEAGLPGQKSSISVERNISGVGEVTINAVGGNIRNAAGDGFSVDAINDISLNSGDTVDIFGNGEVTINSAGNIRNTASDGFSVDAINDISLGAGGTVEISGNDEVSINSSGDINNTALNDIRLNSGRNVEVIAPNGSITLRAGTNSGTLTLTDQSATLAAPDVVLGAANGSSTVSIPGLSGSNDTEILTIDPNGVVGRTPFTSITKLESKVNDVEKSLREVDSAVESIGAMALAVSAIPNLTSGDKKYGCGLGTGVFGSKWAGAAGCVAKVNQDIWINAAITYTPGVSTDYYSTPSVGGRLGAFFQF
jgi:hypothetical protein